MSLFCSYEVQTHGGSPLTRVDVGGRLPRRHVDSLFAPGGCHPPLLLWDVRRDAPNAGFTMLQNGAIPKESRD